MSPETHQLIQSLLESERFMPIVIGGGIVSIVAIRSVAGVIKSVAKERTRREIAAFIAEGSISPEQGERLMKAGGSE
jgi:hypothetical protein